jgi:hypothetical protein
MPILGKTRLPSPSASLAARKGDGQGPSDCRPNNDERSPVSLRRRGGNVTAEIAIINRTAVTLAADSAMTLTVRGAEKTYPAADKLFELSVKDPIGIMVYNNLEFLGLPLDLAIRQFRDSGYCCEFDRLSDAPDKFFEYITKELAPSVENERNHVIELVRQTYQRIGQDFFKKTADPKHRKRNGHVDYATALRATLNITLKHYDELPISECFNDVPEDEIIKAYGETIDILAKDSVIAALGNAEDLELARRIAVLMLHRDEYSDLFSGFVFAGFGKLEIFPSLIAYETDGVILGRLKKRVTEQVLTSRNEISAEIIPFAQRDIVDRYLDGIAPDFESGFETLIETVFATTKKHLFDTLPSVPRVTKNKVLEQIDVSSATALRELRDNFLPKMKKTLRQQIEDMVLFMPKKELASLAEAMVNITSIKRKFSSEKETVGGPIDVAVISKSEGFIWVKRKHYFEPELNPRFFVRKHGNTIGNGQSGGRNGTP